MNKKKQIQSLFLQKIKNKDQFKQSYCFFLSLRLLKGLSLQKEKELINIFSELYGSEYVIEMKRMCLDIEKKIIQTNILSQKFPIDTLILTDGMWPVFERKVFNCEIEQERKEIERKYNLENKKKKIRWERSLETVEVLIRGETESIIEVTPGQLFLLFLFQERDFIDKKLFDKKLFLVGKEGNRLFSSGLLFEKEGKIWYNKNFISEDYLKMV